MLEEVITVPTLKLSPSRLSLYNTYDYNGHNIKLTKRNSILPATSGSRPSLSDRSAKKIRTAIDYLSFVSPTKTVHDWSIRRTVRFQLSFFTLTLSSRQIHSDLELKSQLLNQFIIEIKKSYKVQHYVWRMEKQNNGNTHFHFVSNRFIPAHELRHLWNRIQNKLGYVDRYRANMLQYHSKGFRVNKSLLSKWPLEQQLLAYKSGMKSDWNQPNSTDIKSIVNIRNVSAYISKYMSKSEQHETHHVFKSSTPIGSSFSRLNPSVSTGGIRYLRNLVSRGRHWGCDQKLSKLQGQTEHIDSALASDIEKLRSSNKVYIHDDQYYSVLFFEPKILQELKCNNLFKLLLNQIIDVLGSGSDYSSDVEDSLPWWCHSQKIHQPIPALLNAGKALNRCATTGARESARAKSVNRCSSLTKPGVQLEFSFTTSNVVACSSYRDSYESGR